MRYAALWIAVALGTSVHALHAQDDHSAFAGTRWGDTQAEVAAKLDAAGFTAVTGSDEDVRSFQGTVLSDTTLVFATFDTTRRLTQLVTLLKPPSVKSVERYHSLVELLSRKYGRASVVAELYTPPYKAGDPGLFAGIRTGAVRLATTWKLDTELITLTVGRTGDVVVSYEPAPRAEELF